MFNDAIIYSFVLCQINIKNKKSHMTKLMKVNPLIDPEGAQSGSASYDSESSIMLYFIPIVQTNKSDDREYLVRFPAPQLL